MLSKAENIPETQTVLSASSILLLFGLLSGFFFSGFLAFDLYFS